MKPSSTPLWVEHILLSTFQFPKAFKDCSAYMAQVHVVGTARVYYKRKINHILVWGPEWDSGDISQVEAGGAYVFIAIRGPWNQILWVPHCNVVIREVKAPVQQSWASCSPQTIYPARDPMRLLHKNDTRVVQKTYSLTGMNTWHDMRQSSYTAQSIRSGLFHRVGRIRILLWPRCASLYNLAYIHPALQNLCRGKYTWSYHWESQYFCSDQLFATRAWQILPNLEKGPGCDCRRTQNCWSDGLDCWTPATSEDWEYKYWQVTIRWSKTIAWGLFSWKSCSSFWTTLMPKRTTKLSRPGRAACSFWEAWPWKCGDLLTLPCWSLAAPAAISLPVLTIAASAANHHHVTISQIMSHSSKQQRFSTSHLYTRQACRDWQLLKDNSTPSEHKISSIASKVLIQSCIPQLFWLELPHRRLHSP